MANSDVGIFNLGLAKIGHGPFITSFTDGSKAATLGGVVYGPARDSLLRKHLWKFARKRVILAPLTDALSFDSGNYFQLPVDCLRVVGTSIDNSGSWYVEGNKLIADTTAFNLVYAAQITDPTLFDPLFVQALAAKIGDELSMPLAQSQSLKQEMKNEYKLAVAEAAFVGATERDSEQYIADAFISVHF